MHFLLLLAYAVVVSAGHCRQGGRPKAKGALHPVTSSASTTSTVPATLPTSSTSTTFLTMTSSAAIVPLSASNTASGAGLKASFTQYVLNSNALPKGVRQSRLTTSSDMEAVRLKRSPAVSLEALMPPSRRTFLVPHPEMAPAQLATYAIL